MADLLHNPDDDTFQDLRDSIAEMDIVLLEERREMKARLDWLLATIQSDPYAVRTALGLLTDDEKFAEHERSELAKLHGVRRRRELRERA